MKLIEVQRYAMDCHSYTNHLYDGQPYHVHLKMVVQNAYNFIHLIKDDSLPSDIICACWCHDLIEDCRQTYNDVKQNTNEYVANLVYAVTNEKGKNRKQRANEKYYAEMQLLPDAVFVKYCDRLANIQYSAKTQSSMLSVYRKEHEEFIKLCPGPKVIQREMVNVLCPNVVINISK